MAELSIRREGCAGRITLTRPKALNALSYQMCLAIDAALKDWAADPEIALVLIDAEGERAFCAGGDIAEMYETGRAGDFSYARRFWHDEYRMNARLAGYGKPVVSFLHGFVMGGGVGVGCHASHRVVCESSQISMPECGIGLVPDVGGSGLLARAPGGLGAYLGLTGARLGPDDAIAAGFADMFIPHADWDDVKARLCASGDTSILAGILAGSAAPEGALTAERARIDRLFSADTVPAILEALVADDSDFAAQTLKVLRRNSPLSMACTLEMLQRLGREPDIRTALQQEYRFTWRSMEGSDFLEGIRAAIIDKDRNPTWRHADAASVTPAEVAAMLAALGPDELTFDEQHEATT